MCHGNLKIPELGGTLGGALEEENAVQSKEAASSKVQISVSH